MTDPDPEPTGATAAPAQPLPRFGRYQPPERPPSSRRRIILRSASIGLLVVVAIVAYVIRTRPAGPPSALSANEAVELALFQTWRVSGDAAYVAAPTEVFVVELANRDAQDFLRRNGAPVNLPTDGLNGYLSKTIVVVARGTVTAGSSADATPRAQGFVLAIDPAGTTRFVGIGPPWNTIVPPNAQPVDVPSSPALSNVSLARARLELGGVPLVELSHPPGGLSLHAVAINSIGIPVDPSGTSYPARSLTLIYADGTGRPRLWFSQSVGAEAPHVPGNPLPFGNAESGVIHYAWYAGGWGVDGYGWRQDGRGLFLTAESGPDLPLESIMQTVGVLAGVSPART